MSDVDDTFDEIGHEPLAETDNGQQLYDLLDDTGKTAQGDVQAVVDASAVVDDIEASGRVSQTMVTSLESAGFSLLSEKRPLAGFTKQASLVGAEYVRASLEEQGTATVLAKKLFNATIAFGKSVGSAISAATQLVKDILDRSSGQKPAIDFAVRRLDSLHEELKKAIDERGGVPDGWMDVLDNPLEPLSNDFIRENADKGMGAFVLRKAAAALLASINGKKPSFEVSVVTRPEVVQRAISDSAAALQKLVKVVNNNASVETIRNNPSRIKPVDSSATNALAGLSGMLANKEPMEIGSPDDYQNFKRVFETIEGAIDCIARAGLDGAPFKELMSRIDVLTKSIKEDAGMSDESLAAWGNLTKQIQVATELYQNLVRAAVQIDDIADIFHRVLTNARREMVKTLEIAAERSDALVAKRLMMIADREKENLIETQDAMRNARRKAEEKRSAEA